MNYRVYATEDFVTDEYFIQWVKNPTEESDAFWSAWLSKNPDKDAVIKEARQIVMMLTFSETRAPEGKFLEIWEKISGVDEPKQSGADDSERDTHSWRFLRTWYNIAAVFLVAAATIASVVLAGPDTIVVQTAFGESRALFLPDSTKVTLNANSTLRYASDFATKNREVWLEGEAFFAVTHTEDHQHFIVHTDELQVEVLGTRFNVNSRRGKSTVALEEGKVKLDIAGENNNVALIMKPGELVKVSKDTRKIEKERVEVSDYSSWRMNKLVFVGTPLSEIGQLLEDNYGFKVRFADENLKDQRFTGSASMDDVDELLGKLNKVFGLTIRKQGSELIFQYTYQ